MAKQGDDGASFHSMLNNIPARHLLSESMRTFDRRLKFHETDDIEHTNFQIRQSATRREPWAELLFEMPTSHDTLFYI